MNRMNKSSLPCRSLRVLFIVTLIIEACHPSSIKRDSKGNQNSKPHILLIVADDLGWNDVSWHNPDVVTPNLEELARKGVILNRSYVLPICTPTRSALLTGRYPFTIGRQRSTIRPCEPVGLTLNATLLPQVLKDAGYTTHAVGKWHLGFCSWAYTPTYRGFDTFYGHYNGAEDYYTHSRKQLQQQEDADFASTADLESDGDVIGLDLRNNTVPDPSKKGIYSTYLFASYIEDLLKSNDPSKPMFLYVPFQSVHAPLMVPNNYSRLYKHIHNRDRRIYLGMVTALDEAIGKVVRALKTTGHYDNSIIIFTTDNGGTIYHGGNNWPLRGMKTTLWEGGTRGVSFVHSPLLPNSGTVSNRLIHATDWFKTLVGLAGGVAPTDTDGFDQWESISGQGPSPRKKMVYNIDITDRLSASVRIGHHKLIVGFPGEGDWTPPPELFEGNEIHDDTPPSFPGITSDPREDGFLSSEINWELSKSKSLEYLFAPAQGSLSQSKIDDHQSPLNKGTNSMSFDEMVWLSFKSAYDDVPSWQQRDSTYMSSKKGRHQDGGSEPFLRNDMTLLQKKIPVHQKHIFDDASSRKFTEDAAEGLETTLFPHHDSSGDRTVRKIVTEDDDYITWGDILINLGGSGDTWLSRLPTEKMQIMKNETQIRLYNVKADPEERNNIAEEKLNILRALLEFLFEEVSNRYAEPDIKPEMPSANPKFWNNTWSPGWCIAS